MKKLLIYGLIASGLLCTTSGVAQALPGDTLEDVQGWMQGHPTLRATSGERLLVRRVDTPSRRYSFQASVFPIGGLSTGDDDTPPILRRGRGLSTIRLERFTLVDMVNGVSLENLEEALRVLYGPDVYADYRRSQSTYIYPESSPNSFIRPRADQMRGEVRDGEQYAYWVEIIPNPDGSIHNGSISVLLREDLPGLQAHLSISRAASQ